MKLILQAQVMTKIIARTAKEEKMTLAESQEQLNWLIKNAYEDRQKYDHKYGLYNGDPNDHDELCMWCNFHATIRDACMNNVVLCLDERQSSSDYLRCEECMQHTTWYRRIL